MNTIEFDKTDKEMELLATFLVAVIRQGENVNIEVSNDSVFVTVLR